MRVMHWLLPAMLVMTVVPASAEEPPGCFKPELVGVELLPKAVRPGEQFTMTLKLRNAGDRPAQADYTLFVHIEAAGTPCAKALITGDHAPVRPTSEWKPGQVVVDGPQLFTIPADMPEQRYVVHLGLYDLHGSGQRLLDHTANESLLVSRQAAPPESAGPAGLPPAEIEARRKQLAHRIAPEDRKSLERASWRFEIDSRNGRWNLTDRTTGVLWYSDPLRAGFGEVLLHNGSRTVRSRLDQCEEVQEANGEIRWTTRPLVDGQPAGVTINVSVRPLADPAGIELSYDSHSQGPWQVAGVRLLDRAFSVTEEEQGVVYVPERLGLEVAAARQLPGTREWMTYDNLSMAMCGLVKQGSALLVNWDQVDTRLCCDSRWGDESPIPGHRVCDVSLTIDAPRGRCTLHPLGRGDYVAIAHAYRSLAKAKGWLKTWAAKRKEFPSVDRFLGATDFKPFTLGRIVPHSRLNPGDKEIVSTNYTFEEMAQCAEHWRHDLDIDRAMVVLAGWINRGYDVRHPDILPAAPECGGNEGLLLAAKRIKACGYLFGLHDNYIDMYADAPSWGLSWLSKGPHGVAIKGGNWGGGQAWRVCSIKQVELASRSDTNLPKVAELFGPTVYFIDVTYACPLDTCADPAHPMTRQDDLQWRTRLSMLAKRYFGLFGSEIGQEWAVPCGDYFEGLFCFQTDAAPGKVIPLFPLVYHDCVQIISHEGHRFGPGDEKKLADHVLFATMPVAQFGEHLYWKHPDDRLKIVPLPPKVVDRGNRRFDISYRWKVAQTPRADYGVFVHFLHKAANRPDGIVFQNDHPPKMPTSQWKPGIVEDGPYTVEVPAKFDGPIEIRLGLSQKGQSVALWGTKQPDRRCQVGTLTAGPKGLVYRPAEAAVAEEFWARTDGGWGDQLCEVDAVIKNSWEVLSPLNRLVADIPMTSHEFLTEDRLLQRTRYGDVTITVAYEKPAQIGEQRVPANGFLIESPRYVAFCATRYNGIDYATPTLFTAQSLDGRPIAQSDRVRIFHGFGDPRLRLGDREFRVTREEIVRVKNDK